MKTNDIEQKLTFRHGSARRCRVRLAHWQADHYAVAIKVLEDKPAPEAAADSAGTKQLGAAGLTACFWPGKPMPAACANHAGANLARGD